jgi:isopenicillin N synthase-like dioxygenase
MLEPVEIAPLFGGSRRGREQVDAAIGACASGLGVMVVRVPEEVVSCSRDTRERLLRVFDLPPDAQRTLWRRTYAAENRAVYRGWSPRDERAPVDIYDLGADLAHGSPPESDDPLLEPTPLPAPDLLPGWRETATGYYRGMERIGAALLGSLARWLGLAETAFEHAFDAGNSTLRLMRYHRPAGSGGPPGRNEHVDSGFVTIVAQHGVAGLQAKTRAGGWLDVPAREGELVVNFGALLERWTSGRVRATPHRVTSAAPTRHSIPFFYEPRVDAVIRPLPLADAAPFEPFSYGDHLWAALAAFPNFTTVAALREPRGVDDRR